MAVGDPPPHQPTAKLEGNARSTGPEPKPRARPWWRNTVKPLTGPHQHQHRASGAVARPLEFACNPRSIRNGSLHHRRSRSPHPAEVNELVIRPLIEQSVAAQVSTVVETGSHDFRVPVVSADPTAAWTAEGAEITASDPTITEVLVTPKKLAGLTVVSNELASDSSPAALQVVGDGLVRDLRRKIDAAYFAAATPTNGPAGVGTLSGVSTVDAGANFSNMDWAEEAKSDAETAHATLTAFVAAPATALALSTDQGTNRQQQVAARQRSDTAHVPHDRRGAAVHIACGSRQHRVGNLRAALDIRAAPGRHRGHRHIRFLHFGSGGYARHPARRVRVRTPRQHREGRPHHDHAKDSPAQGDPSQGR